MYKDTIIILHKNLADLECILFKQIRVCAKDEEEDLRKMEFRYNNLKLKMKELEDFVKDNIFELRSISDSYLLYEKSKK